MVIDKLDVFAEGWVDCRYLHNGRVSLLNCVRYVAVVTVHNSLVGVVRYSMETQHAIKCHLHAARERVLGLCFDCVVLVGRRQTVSFGFRSR